MARPPGEPSDLRSFRLPITLLNTLEAEAEQQQVSLTTIVTRRLRASLAETPLPFGQQATTENEQGEVKATHSPRRDLCPKCRAGIVKRGRCTNCLKTVAGR